MIRNKELIPQLCQQVQAMTRSVDELFAERSADEIRYRPPGSNWNALDCIEHLNRTYDWYLPRIRKALENTSPPSKPSGGYRPGYFGKQMTTGSRPNQGRIRFKMKTFKHFEPHTDQRETEAVLQAFRGNQLELERLMQRAARYHLGRIKVTSAIGPILRFKLGDAFQFLLAHNERHLLQCRRLLASSGSVEV